MGGRFDFSKRMNIFILFFISIILCFSSSTLFIVHLVRILLLVSIDRIPSICLDGRIIYIRACYKFEDNFGKVRKRTGNPGCCLNNLIELVFFLRIIKMSKEKRKIGWRQLTIFVRVEINLNRIDGSICRD